MQISHQNVTNEYLLGKMWSIVVKKTEWESKFSSYVTGDKMTHYLYFHMLSGKME